jgi:hypothetical protein
MAYFGKYYYTPCISRGGERLVLKRALFGRELVPIRGRIGSNGSFVWRTKRLPLPLNRFPFVAESLP